MSKSDKYITLREAAEISGYTPDYVGQLIRAGKLEGKQVYSNVAWVTTEEAIREYTSRSKKGKNGGTISSTSARNILGAVNVERLIKIGSYILIGIGILFALTLLYIVSVSIDRHLTERAEQKAIERAQSAPPIIVDEDPKVPL